MKKKAEINFTSSTMSLKATISDWMILNAMTHHLATFRESDPTATFTLTYDGMSGSAKGSGYAGMESIGLIVRKIREEDR